METRNQRDETQKGMPFEKTFNPPPEKFINTLHCFWAMVFGYGPAGALLENLSFNYNYKICAVLIFSEQRHPAQSSSIKMFLNHWNVNAFST